MYYPTLTKEELKDTLKSGIFNIDFKKLDGQIRYMECTLHPDFLPPLKEDYVPTRKESPETIAVWDLEKEAWRSIIISNIYSMREKKVNHG